ncbi:transcriptional regulator [Vibrio sp. SS-MA-C1-2]|uniref:StbB family protein n=1 Tax=Vibrio sp. SS-MA-C1-2 TaxID=2908646 RepID=UPI001F39C19D|nr:StbB family protein [Vibrio sp. SS-MA-C1-2]UJF17235.1 transcriptional regulator [Vibrio sp. SS-MA-C1-2]
MYLKLAVLNNSGNVGKSTICENLLKPRLDNSEIIKVETINNDGTDDKKYSSNEFSEIFQEIYSADCSIIDVGASNIEDFMIKMKEFKGSHEDIDYFIVPVTPTEKQQIDSVSTIEMLQIIGVDAERIKFIFNRANKKIRIEKQYSTFLNKVSQTEISTNRISTIYETNAFSMLSKLDTTFKTVLHDDRDFRCLLREAKSKEERMSLSEERSVKRLIEGINQEFDLAFQALELSHD